MSDTTVHDCAATGIYIGDLDSSACIERCNITRNGGGTRFPTITTTGPGTEENDETNQNTSSSLENSNSTNHERRSSHPNINLSSLINHDNNTNHDDHQQLVPPGHSGMYLEASTAIVSDCLLSQNSLTGLSVVRGGETKISGCDIFGNGSSPVTIEDAHDVFLGLGDAIRGGIVDLGGNYLSSGGGGSGGSSGSNENNVIMRDEHDMTDCIRKTIFPSVNNDHTTVEQLQLLYSS